MYGSSASFSVIEITNEVHSKGRLLLPRSAAAGFGRISLVLRPSPGAIPVVGCVYDGMLIADFIAAHVRTASSHR